MGRTTDPTAGPLRGRCLGRAATWRGGSYCRTSGKCISQDEHAWARDFDLFGPGPATVEEYGEKGVVVETQEQSGSVQARVTQLTNIVQELAELVASSVATTGAQPLAGTADANPTYRDKLESLVPTLRLSSGAAARGSGDEPPGSPSSSSSSSSPDEGEDRPRCRCVEVTSTMRKTAPNSQRTSRVRIRVLLMIVRGVVGEAAVPVLRGFAPRRGYRVSYCGEDPSRG